jgi:hypothetical protein
MDGFVPWFVGEPAWAAYPNPFVFLIAAIYVLVDAVFFTLFKPVFCRLADCRVFESLRAKSAPR